MPKKTFTPEQIVPKLRQIEVLIGQGNRTLLNADRQRCVVSPDFPGAISQNAVSAQPRPLRAESKVARF